MYFFNVKGTPKNGFQILNLHPKKHILKKKKTFFYVLLPK